MGEDKRPASGPFEWVFHTSLLLLGAVIALNVTVAFLRPLATRRSGYEHSANSSGGPTSRRRVRPVDAPAKKP